MDEDHADEVHQVQVKEEICLDEEVLHFMAEVKMEPSTTTSPFEPWRDISVPTSSAPDPSFHVPLEVKKEVIWLNDPEHFQFLKGDTTEVKAEPSVPETFEPNAGPSHPCSSSSGEEPAHHTCIVCNARFSGALLLENHIVTHLGIKPVACNTCKRNSNQRKHFKIQLECHAEVWTFSCATCGFKSKDKNTIMQHVSSHMEDRPLSCNEAEYPECNVCGMKFATEVLLNDHVARHEREQVLDHKQSNRVLKVIVCKTCKRRFLDRHRFERHLHIHWETCNICNHKCRNKKSLERHLAMHAKQRRKVKYYECNVCNVKFATQVLLRYHFLSRHKDKTCVCDNCGYKSSNSRAMKAHCCTVVLNNQKITTESTSQDQMAQHAETQPIVCNSCGYKLSDNETIKMHICKPVQHNVRLASPLQNCLANQPVVCNSCGYTFNDNETMKMHVCTPSQSNVRLAIKSPLKNCLVNPPVLCNRCGLKFSDNETMAMHVCKLVQYHEMLATESPLQNQPIVCNSCGYTFSDNEAMRMHVCKPVHYNGTPATESLLQNHVPKHTENETVACNVYLVQLGTENVLHNNTGEHVCNYCRMSFSRRTVLENHLRTHIKRELLSSKVQYVTEVLSGYHPAQHEKKTLVCDNCGYKSSNNKDMKGHCCNAVLNYQKTAVDQLAEHAEKQPVVCNSCGYKLSDNETMKMHICKPDQYNGTTPPTESPSQNHIAKQPENKTVVCHAYYVKPETVLHKPAATSDKSLSQNHKCFVCNETFETEAFLHNHIGNHPHMCNYCETTFSKRRHLENHLRTHIKGKPLSCNVCDYKCRYKGTLDLHLALHVQEDSDSRKEVRYYKCGVCDIKFATVRLLQSHVARHKTS